MTSILAVLLAIAPQEPVLIENDAACMKCHEQEAADWKPSVHGQQRVGCVGCHGGDQIDKSQPPEKQHAFIEAFISGKKTYEEKGDEEIVSSTSVPMCNKCHQGVVEAFNGGNLPLDSDDLPAHFGEVMDPDSTKWKGCHVCHSHHKTQPQTFSEVLSRVKADRDPSGCQRCHKTTSDNYKAGKEFADAIDFLRKEVAALEEELEKPVPGISQFEENDRLRASEKKLREFRMRQHSQHFEELAKEINSVSESTTEAYKDLEVRHTDTGGRVGWLLAFLAILAVNTFFVRAWVKKGRSGS